MPVGDMHDFTTVAGGVVDGVVMSPPVVPAGLGSPTAMATPPVAVGISTQVHAPGQSASTVHVVAFGWQYPGNVGGVQLVSPGAGAGAGAAVFVEDGALPPEPVV